MPDVMPGGAPGFRQAALLRDDAVWHATWHARTLTHRIGRDWRLAALACGGVAPPAVPDLGGGRRHPPHGSVADRPGAAHPA